MNNKKDFLKLSKKEMAILLMLDRNKFMLLSEIRKSIASNYYYAILYIDKLMKRDLIRERRVGKYRIFYLTEKGEMYVNAIKKYLELI